MTHFIVFYSRGAHRPPIIEPIEDYDEAVRRLFAAEREVQGDPSRGVVMLAAESEDDLRRTHTHYFESLEDMLRLVTG
jgi:hypothetical protein